MKYIKKFEDLDESYKNFALNIKSTFMKIKEGKKLSADELNKILQYYLEVDHNNIEGLENMIENLKPTFMKIKEGEKLSSDELNKILQFYLESLQYMNESKDSKYKAPMDKSTSKDTDWSFKETKSFEKKKDDIIELIEHLKKEYFDFIKEVSSKNWRSTGNHFADLRKMQKDIEKFTKITEKELSIDWVKKELEKPYKD